MGAPDFDSSTAYFKRLGSPIAALATAAGGPVGVVRVSGRSLNFLQSLLGPLPEAGTFRYRPLKIKTLNSDSFLTVDRALILFFKNPESFTGEDVVEIQLHGVPSVLDSVLEEIFRLGAQMALPGEFSFRAVINEKMSLEAAEGIQSAFAMDGLGASWAAKLLGVRSSGLEGVSKRLESALDSLSSLRGRVEAAIDFPEAESEQSVEIQSALGYLLRAKSELSSLLTSFEVFSANAREFSIAIVGQANAGKSTLLNLLAGGKKSLVSSMAGTTRDVVESRLRLPSGQWIKIFDTAGLRKKGESFTPHDLLESEGMNLGVEVASNASALIWVRSLEKEDDFFTEQKILALKKPTIEIFSHQDRVGRRQINGFDLRLEEAEVRDLLENEITKLVRTKNSLVPDSQSDLGGPIISARQKGLIEATFQELALAEEALQGLRPIEIASEHVRLGEGFLNQALGKGTSDAYIGKIFSQFCLGK